MLAPLARLAIVQLKVGVLASLRVVPPYFDNPVHIEALAESVWEVQHKLETPPDKVIVTFHGIPQRYARLGDPYPKQCEETARLLAEAMRWKDDHWMLTYQSRFGREEWLKPYVDMLLHEYAHSGPKRVTVVCPGFATDCLETLEEINMMDREAFLSHGGEAFDYVPALNASVPHVDLMEQVVLKHTQGW